MNNIYDNGEMVIGNVKNIRKYLIENAEETWEIEDMIKDLEDLEDDSIVAIDYDHGMGYSLDYWHSKNDLVKESD